MRAPAFPGGLQVDPVDDRRFWGILNCRASAERQFELGLDECGSVPERVENAKVRVSHKLVARAKNARAHALDEEGTDRTMARG